ncbi:hypothetical protein [Archangium violaceum]|uniref:Uncharacterized protein n=1 Tax=Archangium violaceum Cb vi76 TaxID=1406225 RepID=A0A084SQB1_9BACT|nr:hypothetical protein [Archangium violaceum]KFA90646.1 hypothetical protein Q664_27040 [Archangium violaceum Cb vi76]
MSTPLKRLLAASLILGPATGFFVGRLTAPDTGDRPLLLELARQRALLEEHLARAEAPPPEVRCAVVSPSGGTVDAQWPRAELVQVLRDELARAHHTEAPDTAPRPPPPSEPPARSLAAHQEGHQMVDRAISARRWTTEDAAALRWVLADMTAPQRAEVIRRLLATLNSNTLDVQTQGPPF